MILAIRYLFGLMSNHPNRSRVKTPASNPTPGEILAARTNIGLTQAQAADLIYAAVRTWQQWEAGDRRMHPGLWELFLIKTKDTQGECSDKG